MSKVSLLWMAVLGGSLMGGFGDVLRLALVVDQKGAGVESVTSVDGERTILVRKDAIVTQADVESATLSPDHEGQIDVRLSKEGGEKMKKATQAMKRGVDRLAIIVDGKLVIAPVVQAALNRNFVVTGVDGMDVGELDNLARRISGRPLRREGEEVKLPEVEKVVTVPYTKEEYQEIEAEREKAGIYYLEKIPSEEELDQNFNQGMSFDEVVKIYGKPYGPPVKGSNNEVLRNYCIAPELGPINPKREFVPIGFRVTFKNDHLVSWEIDEGVGWRAEKVVSPKQKQPSPRNLIIEMPKLDFSSEVPDLFAFYEEVKIPNPKQDLTKQDLIDLLGIVSQLCGQIVAGDIDSKAAIDPNCDLVKVLVFNFPEVEKLVSENKGKRLLLQNLDDSLSEYRSEEKPLPVKKSTAKD